MKYSLLILTIIFTMLSCKTPQPIPYNPGGKPPSEKHKTIAVLAMLSNVNFNYVSPTKEELVEHTKKIQRELAQNDTLKNYIGSHWKIVWGPATSNSIKKIKPAEIDSFVTDNAMYVVKNTQPGLDKPLYVVAIAGTNAVSKVGWDYQDFNVFKAVKWKGASGAKISKGTLYGLRILQGMRDPETQKTLSDFFDEINEPQFEIAFTGHSLGGALSPALGLKMFEHFEQHNKKGITVSVYPIAGPTIGNSAFTNYFISKIGNNYHSVVNNYDIVPHAWQYEMFVKIPSLYQDPKFNNGKGFQFGEKLTKGLMVVASILKGKGYTRISPQHEYAFNGVPNQDTSSSARSFIMEAKYQHSPAYFFDGFRFPTNVSNFIINFLTKK